MLYAVAREKVKKNRRYHSYSIWNNMFVWYHNYITHNWRKSIELYAVGICEICVTRYNGGDTINDFIVINIYIFCV